ncbi:hypothetical protein BC941DRAFT_441904, partial [Chlamydoabsidia padenii]
MLHNLGIQTHRILDIHFPTRNVFAMLIHGDYGVTLHDILVSHDILPILFNPNDPTNLTDPKYATMNEDVRRTRVQEVHKGHLLRALRHVRSHVYLPLANALVGQGWLSKEDVLVLEETMNDDERSNSPG